MNIELITHNKQWDDVLFRFASHALFQSWEWGEVLEKTGDSVQRYGMWKRKECVGIFQVVKVLARRGSFLHIRHGPVLKEYTEETISSFTEFMKIRAKQEHVLFFRVNPLIPESFQQSFASAGYKPAAIHAMDAEVCWVLPLDSPLDAIFSQMRKTTRYEIKKAERMGVRVYRSDDLSQFFALYKETAKRQGFVPHKGIQEEFDVFSRNDHAVLYYAEYEGRVIASAIILFFGGQAIYHYGASLRGSPSGAHLIQWIAIQESKRRGMKLYNFWGVAPSESVSHPWKGITLFKQGFGGEESRYLHAQDYPVSPFYCIPRCIEAIRRIKKGY